jgi:hypothetical protein
VVGKNWATIPLLLMELRYKGLIYYDLQQRRKHQAKDEKKNSAMNGYIIILSYIKL